MTEAKLILHVVPKASSDAIVGWHGGALKVKVRAAPEHGRANAAVVELLAEALGVPKSTVTIESGHASRQKRLRVRGLASAAVAARLEAIVGGNQTSSTVISGGQLKRTGRR